MTRWLPSAAIVAAWTLAVTGCGTIIGGSHDEVHVRTSPENTEVSVDPQGQTLRTPTTLSLDRDQDYLLTFSKKGYESQEVQLEHNLRVGILAGDILFGLVPIIVDAATGNWYEVEPERVDVTLQRSRAAAGPDGIRVRLTTDGDEEDMNVVADRPVDVHVQVIDE